jgi:hypothetical protein
MAAYHHRLPSVLRPFAVVHFATKSLVASSAPFTAYLVYETITLWMASAASAVIFVGHSLVSFLDSVSLRKRSSQPIDQTEAIVRVGELLRMSAPASRAQANLDDMIRSALGVVENFSRQVTKSRKEEISVAIALYEGSSTTRLRIRHRNPGNTRPVGRTFDGKGVLGHHACQSGSGPKIVHNIKRMHPKFRKSPTNSQALYHSFLILPLTVERNGGKVIGGFLSIDCTKPYTFYGSRGTTLIVNLEPIVEHIQRLL